MKGDKDYKRLCAVYRMLRQKRLGKQQALCILSKTNLKNVAGTVDIWQRYPLKDMLP